jgi:hypothetical protein
MEGKWRPAVRMWRGSGDPAPAVMDAKRKITRENSMKLVVIEPRHMKRIEGILHELQS